MFLFFKKNSIKVILVLILSVILVYVTNITSIPKSIILFENEDFNIDIIAGLKLEKTLTTSSNLSTKTSINNKVINSKNETKYNLSFLGLNVKTIITNTIPKAKVIPLGNLIGLSLSTKGVLVVGMSEIKGIDNKIYKPYEFAGIEQGDSIIQINNVDVNSTKELISCVSKCKGKTMNITYLKNGDILKTQITPIKTEENIYKIGLWVRDEEAGVGTATFYDKKTGNVGILGHGIQDIDTEELVEISSGEIVTSKIINIEKGEKEKPGRIEGTIDNSRKIGKIYKNTNFGIYGNIENIEKLNITEKDEVEIASRKEILIGKAKIICTLEEGKKEEFEVEIKKIYINNNEDNKSMLVKITDDKLLEKTGGIIQGMSGAPIIQNGKLIGALTHVLVSDPTRGYALFADKMISLLN